jgi:hypothetical protein
MKNSLLIGTMLLVAGCVSTEKLQQQALVFEQGVLADNDPISVLEAYNDHYFKGDLNCEYKEDDNKNKISRHYYNHYHERNESLRDVKDYITFSLMSEPKIKHECLIDRSEKYGSDECILYRRNEYKTSEICWFNFKKYLSADSHIKTEENFAQVSKFYKDGQKQCDEKAETTTQEKKECKDKIRQIIRDYSKNGILKCSKLYGKEYTERLQGLCDYYIGPAKYFKDFIKIGGWWVAELESKIESFGYDNLCDTTGWRSELKKLGYPL